MLIFFNKTINTQQKSDFSDSYHIREKNIGRIIMKRPSMYQRY